LSIVHGILNNRFHSSSILTIARNPHHSLVSSEARGQVYEAVMEWVNDVKWGVDM
jgi:hypothetical protein